MKIRLELFGASREFSNKDHLEIEIQNKASIDDLRNEIIKYIDARLTHIEYIYLDNSELIVKLVKQGNTVVEFLKDFQILSKKF